MNPINMASGNSNDWDERNRRTLLEGLEGTSASSSGLTRRKDKTSGQIACEICGKMYSKGDIKFHLNSHAGIENRNNYLND
jgi:hypothetical protein